MCDTLNVTRLCFLEAASRDQQLHNRDIRKTDTEPTSHEASLFQY